MKNSIAVVILMGMLVVGAFAQHTSTVVTKDQDGNATMTSCTVYTGGDADCVTGKADTRSLKDIHNEVKQREAYCKAQHIPTSRMSAKKNQTCVDAWESYKLNQSLSNQH